MVVAWRSEREERAERRCARRRGGARALFLSSLARPRADKNATNFFGNPSLSLSRDPPGGR